MTRRLLCLLLAAGVCWASANQVADRLARQAKKAQDSGQIVRAYLLYAEAAARDPQNQTYRAERDALASAAKLLTKADIQTADISQDLAIAQDERANPNPPIERATEAEWRSDPHLQPIAEVVAAVPKADFDLRAPAKTLIEQVATVYGLHAIIDQDVVSGEPILFQLTQAGLPTAMEALTAATGTFVFAVSPQVIYFAPDTQLKRDELEPNVLLTFHLPDALGEKDLIEAANAARNVLQMRAIGWDSLSRTVMIRDRVTRARIAKAVLESLLLPRGQLAIEVKFLTIDSDKMYNYGSALQTSFPAYFLGHIGGFTSVQPALANVASLLLVGGGGSLFGFGLANVSFFATESSSLAEVTFDATVTVSDRQTVNLHVGDKYPIAQTLYTGFSQSEPSIYNPAPQITLVDLGLVLKITPAVNGDGDIALDIEAEFNSLGNQTFNTIPSISDRAFKGTVNMREGQEAILAGLDSDTKSFTRNGLIGLSQVPGLNQFLSNNTSDHQNSQTLILVKPTITRLPMSPWISPQFLLGPQRGERVLL